MAKLTRDDVLKLARLARIHLTDEETEQFAEEIGSILDYVNLLDGIDLSDLEPTDQVTGLTNVMRPDEEHDYGYTQADLLKNLPAKHGQHIKVKRMLQ